MQESGEEDLVKQLPADVSKIIVANKIDLLPARMRRKIEAESDAKQVWISAKTGQGMEILRQRIRETVGATDQAEGSFSARQRHTDALKRTGMHLAAGHQAMEREQAGELLAEELRLAQQTLGEITGEMLPDDLLGEIFSSFCIGK
jgi:tRNA modification GTPase